MKYILPTDIRAPETILELRLVRTNADKIEVQGKHEQDTVWYSVIGFLPNGTVDVDYFQHAKQLGLTFRT